MSTEPDAAPIDRRDDHGGREYLRAVMAETPTYWSDGVPEPAAAADDGSLTVYTPAGARQSGPELTGSSWVIPAITIALVLGMVAIIAAVMW